MDFEVGSILEGKVTAVKKFGAFVALPGGKSGLVHISEISSEFIQDINAVISEGQSVKVKVIGIAEDGKIALSIKKANPEPEKSARPAGERPRQRSDAPRVWQPKRQAPQGQMSFEDMMARFKTQSEEKISDLKKAMENRRSGGYSRRRG